MCESFSGAVRTVSAPLVVTVHPAGAVNVAEDVARAESFSRTSEVGLLAHEIKASRQITSSRARPECMAAIISVVGRSGRARRGLFRGTDRGDGRRETVAREPSL